MKLGGGYVPKNRPKCMQQRGGLCPQILRIWHEYHIQVLKMVKKKQLVTGRKFSLEKKSGRNTKQTVSGSQNRPNKNQQPSMAERIYLTNLCPDWWPSQPRYYELINTPSSLNHEYSSSWPARSTLSASLGGYVPYIYCHDICINRSAPVRNAGKNVWPPFPRRPNGTLVKMYGVLVGTPPWSYISWGVGIKMHNMHV